MSTWNPRPYQVKAKRAIYKTLRRHRSALAVLPTGTGKGAMIGMVVADSVKLGKRVLVFVHRKEIVEQLADHVRKWAPGVEPAIERAEQREATDESQVVVASIQSLVGRLDRFPPDRFDLLIYDEFHHSLSATGLTVLDHFAPTKFIGFTATPNRGDEKALAQVVDAVAVDIQINDSVRDGWLTPVNVRTIELKSLDLSSVRKRSGDLMAGDLGALMSEVKVLREAIVPAVTIAGAKQTLVFTATIAHMHAVAETVRQVADERGHEIVVATVDGKTPKAERAKIFDAFRERRIHWLVNVDVATEGFDAPTVEVVVMLRPTLSRAVYMQQLGRGTRPLPGTVDGIDAVGMNIRLDEALAAGELQNPGMWLARTILEVRQGSDAAARRLSIATSAKRECLVLDFTDNSGRYDLTSAMDLLGGDYDLPEQKEAQRLLDSGKFDNLMDALEAARAARQAARLGILARAGDPFALFGLTPSKDPYGRSMTAGQGAVIRALRIPRVVDFREANMLLTEIARRDAADLCLYSQAAILARLWYPVEDLRDLNRREATAMIAAVAVDYWQRPANWNGARS